MSHEQTPHAGSEGLHSPVTLTRPQIAAFRRNGFVKIKNALPESVIAEYGPIITQSVIDLNTMNLPLEERDTYHKAFLQITNIWEKSEKVAEFVMGERLGKMAADLLGTRGVRLYHDQALYKEPGGGHTPWHADQQYWPLASEKCVTAWIPLQETPIPMGPLAFGAGSHLGDYGRGLAISDESEAEIARAITNSDVPYVEEPFELGEVSFHYGWTFHRAGGNSSDVPRAVMTIIYMDIDMRLAEPANSNQQKDREVWCPGVAVGEVINSPLNPVIYELND